MSECFGPHSIFLTVTPDDECSYRVKMYASNGNVIEVPMGNCSERDCIADFNMRHATRTKYPGSCSLNYQAAMQSVCTLLGWDFTGKKQKKTGIFGKCFAFVRADEEQGRHTLHGH